MPGKRARDEDAGLDAGASPATDETRKPKKAKHGFRVGPENLPDGAWRRKVTKIKKDLITKAKVKKQYAKIKAEHQKQAVPTLPTDDDDTKPADDATTTQATEPGAPAPAQIHPSRQAMLDAPSSTTPRNQQPQQPQDQEAPQNQPPHQKHARKQRRPDYYTKELAAAERAKQQAEARAAEAARREQQKQTRIAERERYRRAMAKAKTPGKDGKVKIGREGKLLLERVRRVMGES